MYSPQQYKLLREYFMMALARAATPSEQQFRPPFVTSTETAESARARTNNAHHAQAARYTLAAFPELRNAIFHLAGMPLTFSQLLASSSQGRGILVDMCKAQTGRVVPSVQKAPGAARAFDGGDWPASIQMIAPLHTLGTPRMTLPLPSMSVNAISEQMKPFWQGVSHPGSWPARMLENDLVCHGLPSMRSSVPSIPDIVPPDLQEIETYGQEAKAAALHSGFDPALRDMLRALLPQTSLSSMIDYSDMEWDADKGWQLPVATRWRGQALHNELRERSRGIAALLPQKERLQRENRNRDAVLAGLELPDARQGKEQATGMRHR